MINRFTTTYNDFKEIPWGLATLFLRDPDDPIDAVQMVNDGEETLEDLTSVIEEWGWVYADSDGICSIKPFGRHNNRVLPTYVLHGPGKGIDLFECVDFLASPGQVEVVLFRVQLTGKSFCRLRLLDALGEQIWSQWVVYLSHAQTQHYEFSA